MSKKQDILDAALKIFAEVGTYTASTKTIAIEANVSEALIFKHFKSKDNLIEEILKSGYREATKLVSGHLEYKSPEDYIANLFDLPKILVLSNKNFWQMQYKITPLNTTAMTHHQFFMNSSHELLVKAFTELNYKEPVFEAEIALFIIDGLWKYIAVNEFEANHVDALIRIAKRKYNAVS